jgi:ubiquinone/menaquinone biosynthesis C-methylase UbiE
LGDRHLNSESLRSEATAFDAMAESYDADFTASALGRVLRARVWERFDACFTGYESLLELGCGTGEDAIHLAQRGHRILATDVSAKMLRIAQHKAERVGVAARIRFICAPMESLAGVLGVETFDGIYSNFGAVNCVADVPALARMLATRLVPGAPLVLVPMGRHVPWEWAWYLARGDRERAFRRLREGGLEWRGLRVHYPSPAMLGRSLAPSFEASRRCSLGFALPPSYAAGWLDSAPRTLAALNAIEHAMGRFTAALADHYIFEAVRS